jgi:magnesium chelatase family protein
MLAKIKSVAVVGLNCEEIEVEVDLSNGLPCFNIVGLPDKAVEEAKERVRSAIKNSGAQFPQKRITVNLAPANIRKEGASFDLPIAIGILAASSQINSDLSSTTIIGELSLSGQLRPVKGVLPIAIMCQQRGRKALIVSEEIPKKRQS